MSSGNVWQWLFEKYAGTDKRILPGADGEPWVCYGIIGDLNRQEPETVSKLVTKHRIERHPVFAGLVKITSFERVKLKDGEH